MGPGGDLLVELRRVDLARLTAYWTRVRDSLWFIPGILTLGAVVLALITIQLDAREVIAERPEMFWLFGSAAGSRGVLSAIASGIITVTGVVFSVTIVALQLASTQFTPRVLRKAVETGEVSKNMVEIVKGLDDGEVVLRRRAYVDGVARRSELLEV
jgi:uncharacterized membrane protein